MKKARVPGFFSLSLFLSLFSVSGCATFHMQRGDTLASRGKYDAAVKEYSASLNSEDSYEGHLKRGIVLEKLGMSEPALEDFTLAAQGRPEDNREALFYKGELLLKQGELEKALDVSDELAAENPGDVMAVSLRAEVWFAQGDYRQALQDFDTALKGAGNDRALTLKLLYNRAITLFKLGKFREARLAYQDYIDERKAMGKGLRQKDYYNMGLFCYSDYDFVAARKYWERLSHKKREAIVARIEEESLKDLADK